MTGKPRFATVARMEVLDPGRALACERAERSAFDSLAALAPEQSILSQGLRFARIAGALALASRGLHGRMYNHVFGLGLDAPATTRDLDALIAEFAAAGAETCRVTVAPSPIASDCESLLRSAGFAPHSRSLRLWRDGLAAPSAPTSLTHTAPWRSFGAFEGDALVGCGALFHAGPHAWLGMGGTRVSHRGRGAQSALIAARIAAGRERGATLFTAETAEDTRERPNPSTHNALRLGFAEGYARTTWARALRAD